MLCCPHPYFPAVANQVTPEQRSHVKAMAYGLLYGKGVQGLAHDLGTDATTADAERRAFLNALPGVELWQVNSSSNSFIDGCHLNL